MSTPQPPRQNELLSKPLSWVAPRANAEAVPVFIDGAPEMSEVIRDALREHWGDWGRHVIAVTSSFVDAPVGAWHDIDIAAPIEDVTRAERIVAGIWEAICDDIECAGVEGHPLLESYSGTPPAFTVRVFAAIGEPDAFDVDQPGRLDEEHCVLLLETPVDPPSPEDDEAFR